jgi:S-methylmethionine-dependent homocysteine/selenocysteine methylase
LKSSPELLVLDGGTGRELARVGAPFRQPEWSALALIEAPHFVSQVHRSYIDAGADIITTNSYAVVPFHIGEQRFREEGVALAARAGRLARAAAGTVPRKVRVAGSLPPTCGSYRPDWFDPALGGPILAALVEGLRPQVDHWQAETLSAIEEAELARRIIGKDAKPLWFSFTLEDESVDPSVARLRSGQTVSDAVRASVALGAGAVLFNCSQPEVMESAIDAAREVIADRWDSIRVGVYANAFPPQPREATANAGLDEIRADLGPAHYLGWARKWRSQGASVIGGCCGIGPEHIAALQSVRGSLVD